MKPVLRKIWYEGREWWTVVTENNRHSYVFPNVGNPIACPRYQVSPRNVHCAAKHIPRPQSFVMSV